LALSLVVWTALTAQAALVLQTMGSGQIALLSSLFLLVSALLVPIPMSSAQRRAPAYRLILLIGSALAVSFTGFATNGSVPAQISTASLPVLGLLAGALLALGILALVFSKRRSLDQAGLLVLLILLTLGIFGLGALQPTFWWRSVLSAILSVTGIWMAARAFAVSDMRAGLVGLGFWAIAVLQATLFVEQNWIRVALLALFSLVAVAFYLNSEKQNAKVTDQSLYQGSV